MIAIIVNFLCYLSILYYIFTGNINYIMLIISLIAFILSSLALMYNSILFKNIKTRKFNILTTQYDLYILLDKNNQYLHALKPTSEAYINLSNLFLILLCIGVIITNTNHLSLFTIASIVIIIIQIAVNSIIMKINHMLKSRTGGN